MADSLAKDRPMLRLALALPLAICLATSASAFDVSAMSAAEREAFRAEVRAYLLENPEVLMEAIGVLEDRRATAEAQGDADVLRVNAERIYNDPASWSGGNPQGDVTVVEFTDYRCGYCRKAHDEVAELVGSDGNIRFVIKEFPILGDASVLSSRFAIAVRQLAGDEAYKAAHDALIALRGEPDTRTLTRLAGDLGLDAAAVLGRMDSPEVTAVIAANHELGMALRVNGTPTFVINGTIVRGYLPLDQMRAIVAEEREAG
jgi:protein-disulfide isomerase